MSIALSPESRVVVRPVRRLMRRGSQSAAQTARAREPRALAGLMRRFSHGKHGEGVSLVAAPAPPLTDSLARTVALGADTPAEGVEPTRPTDVTRHPPHKAKPDEAAAAPYPLLEHGGEPALLTGALVCHAYGNRAATETLLPKFLCAVGDRAVREARTPRGVECIERV
jgi:hypothetical protein